jgi:amino acid transporter
MAPRPSASLYARTATGLVRGISVPSAIALNVSFMGVAYAVLVATQEPYAFPGGSILWTTIITAALCVFPVLVYGLFLTAMPRTGGDYIFVSRTLHPWLGLAASFNISFWYTVNTAYLAYLAVTLGLSSGFTTMGVTIHSATLVRWGTAVTSKGWSFGLGAAFLVLVAIIVSLDLRRALAIVRGIFAVSIVGVLVAIVLMLVRSRADFVAAVARFHGSYSSVIRDAHAAGFTGGKGFSLSNTLLAAPLAFAAFGYAIVTAYTGGEVKSARITGLKGMLYALLIGGVLTAIVMGLALQTFGADFLGSATYLSNTGSKAYPFASPSFFFFFVSMLTHSTVLIVIIGISFIAATIATLPPSFYAVTRSMFAWSFDRVVPPKISEVNELTHTPLIANAIVLLVAIAYLAFIAWGPSYFLDVLYTLLAGQILTFLVVFIAGMAFPWRRRHLYEASPIRRSIGPVPLITAVAVVAFAVYGFFLYSLLATDALGANQPAGLWTMAGAAIVSLLLYPIARWLNARRGTDIGLAQRELPPD